MHADALPTIALHLCTLLTVCRASCGTRSLLALAQPGALTRKAPEDDLQLMISQYNACASALIEAKAERDEAWARLDDAAAGAATRKTHASLFARVLQYSSPIPPEPSPPPPPEPSPPEPSPPQGSGGQSQWSSAAAFSAIWSLQSWTWPGLQPFFTLDFWPSESPQLATPRISAVKRSE